MDLWVWWLCWVVLCWVGLCCVVRWDCDSFAVGGWGFCCVTLGRRAVVMVKPPPNKHIDTHTPRKGMGDSLYINTFISHLDFGGKVEEGEDEDEERRGVVHALLGG